MTTKLTAVGDDRQNNSDKKCAGNGCSKIGIHPVTIVYINKTGWFCESCKNLIEREGLADKLNFDEENSTQSKGLGALDHHPSEKRCQIRSYSGQEP